MKAYCRLLLAALLIMAVAVPAALADVEWADDNYRNILARAKKENKHIFIDFYAVWCGPCKMLEKTTYKDEKVIKLLNSIISVKLDAEKGEGKELARKLKIRGYPTLVLLDSYGVEIDRYIGYLDADSFLETMQNYMKGINTIAYYKNKLEENGEDVEVHFNLGEKYANIADTKKAEKYLGNVIEFDPKNEKGFSAIAYLHLGYLYIGDKKYDKSADCLSTLIATYPDGSPANQALPLLARVYEKMGKEEECLETYRVYIDKNPDDPRALNAFAWFCASNKMAMDEAIPVAEKAIELSNGSAGYMDTLAELHYAKGDFEKAISIGEEAVKKDPEDQYLKDQVAKFRQAADDSASTQGKKPRTNLRRE